MKSKIKLVCCDIDGTLIKRDGSLSDANVAAIKRVQESYGVPFAIVTGRMHTAITPYINKLGLNGPSSCLNGAILFDRDGNMLTDHRLSTRLGLIVNRGRELANVEMLAIAGDEWYVESKESELYHIKRAFYNKDAHEVGFSSLLEANEMNKFLFMSPSQERLDQLYEFLKGEIKSNEVTFYTGSGFLEVMPGSINKGTGIEDLKKFYGIESDEIMALGDDMNDIAMLKRVRYSVAMGNALLSAKESARIITKTNEMDGVAAALDVFFPKME